MNKPLSYTFWVPAPVNYIQRLDVVGGFIVSSWANPHNELTKVTLEKPIPFNKDDYKDYGLARIYY
jgi:hypothetical protein